MRASAEIEEISHEGQVAGTSAPEFCHSSLLPIENAIQYAGVSLMTLFVLGCLLREIRLLIKACRS